MDKDIYRLVPYRFAIDETNTDMCKLEKLANLFPEMKGLIELGKFFNVSKHKKKQIYSIYFISIQRIIQNQSFTKYL